MGHVHPFGEQLPVGVRSLVTFQTEIILLPSSKDGTCIKLEQQTETSKHARELD